MSGQMAAGGFFFLPQILLLLWSTSTLPFWGTHKWWLLELHGGELTAVGGPGFLVQQLPVSWQAQLLLPPSTPEGLWCEKLCRLLSRQVSLHCFLSTGFVCLFVFGFSALSCLILAPRHIPAMSPCFWHLLQLAQSDIRCKKGGREGRKKRGRNDRVGREY